METFKKGLKIIGIITVSLFLIVFVIAAIYGDDSKVKERKEAIEKLEKLEKGKQKEKEKEKESTPSERAPIRFSSYQAEQFMQNLCRDLNQTLMRKKTIYVDGKKVYMFMSVAENGMTCVSTVSDIKLEVMSSDCGDTQTKINQRIYLLNRFQVWKVNMVLSPPILKVQHTLIYPGFHI